MSASSSSLADRVQEEVSGNDRGGVVFFIRHFYLSYLMFNFISARIYSNSTYTQQICTQM